jgi:hypothetical protein
MQECDLVMKGGITSGVVYPHALVEISRQYRMRNIGGTSAGSIAATFAAAAEYRRQTDPGDPQAGFDEIAKVADELGATMINLFQPNPRLKPMFGLLVAAVSERARTKGKADAVLRAAAGIFAARLLLALLLVAGLAAFGILTGNGWAAAFGVVLVLFLLFVSILVSVRKWVSVHLPAHNFGLCSGRTQPGGKGPGFTDWMADKIDLIAGRDPAGAPLRVGDLDQAKVQVAAMTTDLSSRRPYQLPLRTRIHYFREDEFRRIFAPRIVDYLLAKAPEHADPDFTPPPGYHALPVGPDFPVLFVARMSLSFPILIESVPLYRRDFGLEGQPLRRCLFSDGGISSNFPIHFFDELMPVRPTLGIALGDWEPARDRQGTGNRIAFPTRARQTTNLPVRQIDGLGAFLSSIIGSAKDWQDTLQSMLPGYAERIVTVLLDPAREGGLNLNMDQATIASLTIHGRAAGEALVQRFSYADAAGNPKASGFDEHRYHRAVSLLPKLEASLHAYAVAMDSAPSGVPGALTGLQVLTQHDPAHYELPAEWRANPLATFAQEVRSLAGGQPRLDHPRLPVADGRIRLQANADRVPRNA